MRPDPAHNPRWRGLGGPDAAGGPVTSSMSLPSSVTAASTSMPSSPNHSTRNGAIDPFSDSESGQVALSAGPAGQNPGLAGQPDHLFGAFPHRRQVVELGGPGGEVPPPRAPGPPAAGTPRAVEP